ncbi:hypothetical protein DH2020_006036 [Rehmannia glutinosa]|uniref:Uncharacterized protein n=1 Tax=Rehmannia glutinosa TaxID=99300 RepID=A0ABR0XHS9_REHGL
MVPSREYSGIKQPCFPQCLDWLTENQNPDGSWGLNPGHPNLIKDSLSCTLSCLLALHKWNIGYQLIQRGLDFIESNGWAATHNDKISPTRFNIIFPAMVNYAKELDLTLPLSPIYLIHCFKLEIQKLATTAAALIHSHDDKCFEYLNSMLKACNNWGTSRKPYTWCWQEKDEQIFTDITCRAMAFRLLRVKGYDVSSDELEDYMNRERFFNTISIQYSGITTVLELYRASHVRMYGESILEKIHAWTSGFLKQQLLNQSILDKRLQKQIYTGLGKKHSALWWNMQPETTYCSQEVEILFTALYNTVNDVAEKVYANQGYCVKHDLVRMWLELLTNFARTMDFRSDNNVPTLDEYLSFAWKSTGSELCVFTPIHFLGMQLSKQMFTCEEYTSLFKHASMVCRLLNDLNSFKREEEEMTLNSVIVQTVRGISEEEAILKVQQLVEYHRSKMVKMVYESKGSIIPRECKQLFWKVCKIAHCFYPYEGGDEFSSPRDIVKDLNAVIYEPLKK